ncbi:hypothetical protein, partial [Parabacteroides sp.]
MEWIANLLQYYPELAMPKDGKIINNLYNLIEIIEQIVSHYIIYLLIIKTKTHWQRSYLLHF